MKRLGTENLSFGRSYENFGVSPAKPIWRSFAQKWPKSAYIKACIKRNLNNTMQNLTLLQAFCIKKLFSLTDTHSLVLPTSCKAPALSNLSIDSIGKEELLEVHWMYNETGHSEMTQRALG